MADSIRDVQTGQAILNGLTFRGRVDDPASKDSLVTVTGNVIYQTGRYFCALYETGWFQRVDVLGERRFGFR